MRPVSPVDHVRQLPLDVESLDRSPGVLEGLEFVAGGDKGALACVEFRPLIRAAFPAVAHEGVEGHAAPVRGGGGLHPHEQRVGEASPRPQVQVGSDAEIGVRVDRQGRIGQVAGQVGVARIPHPPLQVTREGMRGGEGQHPHVVELLGQQGGEPRTQQDDDHTCHRGYPGHLRPAQVLLGRHLQNQGPIQQAGRFQGDQGGNGHQQVEDHGEEEAGGQGERAGQAEQDEGADHRQQQVPAARQIEAVQHLEPEEEAGQGQAQVRVGTANLPQEYHQQVGHSGGQEKFDQPVVLVAAQVAEE